MRSRCSAARSNTSRTTRRRTTFSDRPFRRPGGKRRRNGNSPFKPISSRGFVKTRPKASPRRIDRRSFLLATGLLTTGIVAATAAQGQAGRIEGKASPVQFVNVGTQAGLTLRNWSGDLQKTTINETVGSGVCLYDVDGDGRVDVFLPNGSRGRPFPPGEEPRSALYRNKGDGTFEDVTDRAGVASVGYWAQGCAFGDYDGDGTIDLFLSGFGHYKIGRAHV